MALERSPPGGITIGGYFYRPGVFIPNRTPVGLGPPGPARAPPGGITIGGYPYRSGQFIPQLLTDEVILPPELFPGTRIVDALVQVGPAGDGNLMTIRVHVSEGMDASGVLDEIEAAVEVWKKRYQQKEITRLVDFWRQR